MLAASVLLGPNSTSIKRSCWEKALKTYALAVAKFYWQQFHDDEAVPRTSSSTVEIDVFLDLYNSSANSGGQKPGTDETDEKKGTKRKSLAL